MATAVKQRRGNTSEHSSFTGLEAEITVNTETKTIHVHDGSTAGGIPLAKKSEVSSVATQITTADEGTDAECFPVFTTAAVGDLAPKTDTAFKYNASNGAVTATTFIGSFTGDVTGDVTGNVSGSSGSCTGNAASATTAATATSTAQIATATTGSGTAFIAMFPTDGSVYQIPRVDGELSYDRDNHVLKITGKLALQDGDSNTTTIQEGAGQDITLTLPSATGTLALTSDVAGTTLTEAAQTNITSLGTLTGLTTGATTVNGALTVNDNSVEIVSTDAGATVNPILSLYRNSASPAVSDDLGAIQFHGEDDGGNKTLYAQIHGFAEDETGGTEDGQIHFSVGAAGGLEDPTMTLTRSGLKLRSSNDLIFESAGLIRFEGVTNNAHDTELSVEDPTADRFVTLPDGSGVLEVGSLATQSVVSSSSTITHTVFRKYKGQKFVYTGSSDLNIQLPDVAADSGFSAGTSSPETKIGDVGSTWTICNAGSANVILDLNGSGSAQTLKILTGAAVSDVGSTDPHIVAGGVATLVCTGADNYILFGSGVVDNS